MYRGYVDLLRQLCQQQVESLLWLLFCADDSDSNRELYLPVGNYEMVYWGTPKYEEPIYAYPAVREPAYSIGGDMAQQDFTLLKMSDSDAYYPTYDLVFACHLVKVGTEDLDTALKRVVAGLKIILKD